MLDNSDAFLAAGYKKLKKLKLRHQTSNSETGLHTEHWESAFIRALTYILHFSVKKKLKQLCICELFTLSSQVCVWTHFSHFSRRKKNSVTGNDAVSKAKQKPNLSPFQNEYTCHGCIVFMKDSYAIWIDLNRSITYDTSEEYSHR